jgi:cyclase
LRADLVAIQAAAPEFAKVINPLSNLTFDRNLTLHLGGRDVEVKWLGRGNTAGDAIVWVPDSKTLLTGDTVVYPTPYGIGSYFSEWPAVLQKMIDMKATAIVPGHGPVMHDYAYFEQLKQLFAALTAQVKAAVAKGMSLEDTRKAVTLADFSQRFAGNDRFRKRAFQDFFVYPGVTRAYEEATGKMSEEGS